MKYATLPFFTLFTLAALACDDTSAPLDLPPRETCTLAVVNSDYISTAVSLLTSDGRLCAPDLITSGSRPPGLLTALSGDIALPSSPAPDGLLYLIDRYPNAVVTALDPDTAEVLTQEQVSPGFAGNPQDIAFTANSPLIARLQRSNAGVGSDLYRSPPAAPIDLSAFAEPGLDPMPTRFARTADQLWIGLTHLSADFKRAGPGRVIGLDPATLAVTHIVDLPELQNCGNIAAAPSGLWIVCSGLFIGSTQGPQLDHSGLAYLTAPAPNATATPLTITPTWFTKASDLRLSSSPASPLGFTIAALDDDRAFVVALGDLATNTPDRLLLVARSGPLTIVAESTRPFDFGAVLPRPADDLILLADANAKRPRIRRFTWPTTTNELRELAPITASLTGLPPRHIAIIR